MRRSRALIIGGAVAGTAILLLGIASAIFCEATLRAPRQAREPVIPAGFGAKASWRVVSVAARDRVRLEGWFVRPTTAWNGRCVMVLHGIADSRTGAAGFAAMFLSSGYSVLLPDSRAHGRSGGQFVTYGLMEKYDALEWAHWLRAEGCGEIYGLGESLGASILIQASAVQPAFRAIVAECPYSDLRTIAEYRLRQVALLPRPLASVIVAGGEIYARLRYGLDFTRVAPTSAMAATSTPILLIHGTSDSQTPSVHSQRLAAVNPHAILWLVAAAEHVGASSTEPERFRERVLGWFASH